MLSSTTFDSSTPARRFRARALLVLFALTTAFFVAVTFSPLKSGFADAADRGPGDVGLYRAEVERIRAGESYYDAAQAELVERGYPTHSVFNWRTPLPVWLVGALPQTALAKALLGLAAFALICLSFHLLADDGGTRQGMVAALLLLGALLPCVLDDLLVMSELWSGVFVALSVVLLGLRRTTAGTLAGIAALFFRELAAPYCLVAIALTIRERQFRQLGLWIAGLAAYGLFMGWHVAHVLPRLGPGDAIAAHGWLRFGGAGFLISTAQMNTYLLLLPQWVTAVYLAVALFGCVGWRSTTGKLAGLTLAAYAIAFAIAGNDYNQYWGSMIAPLMCLAASRFPITLRNLWNQANLPAFVTRQARAAS